MHRPANWLAFLAAAAIVAVAAASSPRAGPGRDPDAFAEPGLDADSDSDSDARAGGGRARAGRGRDGAESEPVRHDARSRAVGAVAPGARHDPSRVLPARRRLGRDPAL